MKCKGFRVVYVVVVVVGAVLAIAGGVLYPVVDHIIREKVREKVTIADNDESESYEVWKDNPIPMYTQFYLFNVDNGQGVKNGDKPVLTQMGPYTYRLRRYKYDIIWYKDGTANYKQKRTWHFVRDMSVGSDTDMVQTLNPLIAAMAQSLKWFPPIVAKLVSRVLSLTGSDSTFIHKQVKEVIWGYDDPGLKMLKGLNPAMFNETKVGYFIRRNNTNQGVFRIETGAGDMDDLCTIKDFNGKTHVNAWTTPWANMVNGTDGSCAEPFMWHKKKVTIFQSDICRSLKIIYKKCVESPQGIKLRRFVLDPDNFGSPTENPDNIGFCTPQTHCLPKGLLNTTMCEPPLNSVGIPVVMSSPHFLNADPSVQDSVDGLHPNEQEHQTTVDIEPWTGLTLQVNKRIQINFFIEEVPGVVQTTNLRRLFFPIMWLNESIVVDDKHADIIKDDLFRPMDIMRWVKIGLLVLGGVLILTGVILIVWDRYHSRNEQTVLLAGKENQNNSYDATGGWK